MRSSSFSFFTLLYYVFKQLFHYPINFHEKTISNSFSQTQFPTSPGTNRKSVRKQRIITACA